VGIDGGSILDVEELDAASNNGVDHVRALRDEAIFTPAQVKYRVYIVDEVHMLSTAAFNALLKILEEPPQHLIFILATTEAHKVPATILSRCQRYAFRRVGAADIAGRLRFVAEQEGLALEDDATGMLSRLADGSMRDALALLDQCATGQTIDVPLVQRFLGLAGTAETVKLLTAIGAGDVEGALAVVNALYYAGKDMGALLGELAALLRDILFTRIAPKGGENLLSGSFDRGTIEGFSTFAPEMLLRALTEVTEAMADLGRSGNRKLAVEVAVIRLCDASLSGDVAALQARVATLEQQIAQGVPTIQAIPPAPVAEVEMEVSAPITPVTPPPEPRDDAPPWDVDVPTPEPVAPEPVTPEPIAPVAQMPQVVKDTGANPSGDIWQQVLERVQSDLDMSIYTLIGDANEVSAVLDGDVLNIYVENDFTRAMVEAVDVMTALGAAASAISGRAIRVQVQAGRPVGTVPSSKLDALTQKGFGNITIK